jgi:hypothetical protein
MTRHQPSLVQPLEDVLRRLFRAGRRADLGEVRELLGDDPAPFPPAARWDPAETWVDLKFGACDPDAEGSRSVHADGRGGGARLVRVRPGAAEERIKVVGVRFEHGAKGWWLRDMQESDDLPRDREVHAVAAMLERLGPLPLPESVSAVSPPASSDAPPALEPRPPEPLPDWRAAAREGRTLEAIALLEEACTRGQREAQLFFELSRLNERLADETPAEYGLARAARYATAIENIRQALAEGGYPGDVRLAEREIERLTEKVRGVQPPGPIRFA